MVVSFLSYRLLGHEATTSFVELKHFGKLAEVFFYLNVTRKRINKKNIRDRGETIEDRSREKGAN